MSTEIPLYAKQPIVTSSRQLFGYELLFRPTEKLEKIHGDSATANVVLNALMLSDPILTQTELSLFINCTTEWLMSDIPLFKENVVLEVLESIEYAPGLDASVQRIKNRGFNIALDDFSMELDSAKLLSLADFVKIDVQAMSPSKIKNLTHALSPLPLKIVAEKVETLREFEFCRELGIDYFQGYFFAQPEIKLGKVLQSNVVVAANLIIELSKPEPAVEYISDQLKHDVNLTTRLLAIVNSSSLSHGTQIASVHHAVVTLGFRKLAAIISYVLMTEMTDTPDLLVQRSLTAAIAMENLADFVLPERRDEWFLVGFLSKVDVVFGMPLHDIFSQIIVTDYIRESVQSKSHSAGKYLRVLEALIEGDWQQLPEDHQTASTVLNALLRAEEEYVALF